MEETAFDRLARAATGGGSRRSMLAAVLGIAAGRLGPGAATARPRHKKPGRCQPGWQRCQKHSASHCCRPGYFCCNTPGGGCCRVGWACAADGGCQCDAGCPGGQDECPEGLVCDDGGCCVGAMVCTALAAAVAAPPRPRASGSAAVTYTGHATDPDAGGAPVPGTLYILASGAGAGTTLCGQAEVDASGTFTIAVDAAPGCVRQTTHDPAPHHIFLLNGTNVHYQNFTGTLDNPATLGQTVPVSLNAPLIPGVPLDVLDQGPVLIGARFYGQVQARNHAGFAPQGTSIRLTAKQGGTACGCGQVWDGLGHYVVDVPPIPGCIRTTTGDVPPNLQFVINGNVVAQHAVTAQQSDPTTLALASKESLTAAARARSTT